MKTHPFVLRVLMALVLVVGAAAAGAHESTAAAGAQQPQRPPADEEFVPVKDLGDQEQLPAAPLVMAAYAVAWISVLLYVWSIWRRLSKVEGEIAALSRRIDSKIHR